MKKSVKCLIMVLLITIVLSTMVSCSTQEEDYRIKNPTKGPSVATLNPDWTPMPQPTDAGGAELPGEPYDYINPERLFNMGEWMDIEGVKFRLNSVEFTKKAEGIDPEKMNAFHASRPNFGEMVDAAGNLYGNHSYVILCFEIQNNTTEAMQINLAGIDLSEHVQDERYSVTNLQYIEPAMYASPDDGLCLVQSNETLTFKYYSTIADHFIDDDTLYFHIPSFLVTTVPIVDAAWYYDYSVWVPINKDKSEVDVYAAYQDKRDFVNPERIYNMGETAEIKGMTFRVNDVTMQKELEGISMDRIRYPDYEKKIISSDGTFKTGEYSRVYVKANVTIKNLTEQPIKICTSAIYLSTPHSDGIISQGAAGVTPSMTTNLKYDDFYNFQPGEEVTFDIYYIEHDRCLTDDTLMIHFPLNMGLQDAENPECSYDYDIFVPIKRDKSEVNIYGG